MVTVEREPLTKGEMITLLELVYNVLESSVKGNVDYEEKYQLLDMTEWCFDGIEEGDLKELQMVGRKLYFMIFK